MQTISETKIHINPITQQTLDMFVKRVKEHEENNLSQIILFGSVARGEANRNSDIDVLVVLKECPYEKRIEVSDISADVKKDMDFDENAYLQALSISKEESTGLDFYGLINNVEKEGVILYDNSER